MSSIDSVSVGGPVHWVERVPGTSNRVRVACKQLEWELLNPELLDPNREALYPVTCPDCLNVMSDSPTIVGSI